MFRAPTTFMEARSIISKLKLNQYDQKRKVKSDVNPPTLIHPAFTIYERLRKYNEGWIQV